MDIKGYILMSGPCSRQTEKDIKTAERAILDGETVRFAIAAQAETPTVKFKPGVFVVTSHRLIFASQKEGAHYLTYKSGITPGAVVSNSNDFPSLTCRSGNAEYKIYQKENILRQFAEHLQLALRDYPNQSPIHARQAHPAESPYSVDAIGQRKEQARVAGLPYCPRCGSTSLSANKKGFGFGKAAAGAFVAGPVGLLAGGIGSGKVEVTCLNCGYKFRPGQK